MDGLVSGEVLIDPLLFLFSLAIERVGWILVGRTCCFIVETVQGTSSVCDVIYPLGLCSRFSETAVEPREERTGFLGFRYHHMAIHEDAWYALVDPSEDGGTCTARINKLGEGDRSKTDSPMVMFGTKWLRRIDVNRAFQRGQVRIGITRP